VTTGDYAPERIYIIGGDTTEFPYGVNLTQIYDPENDVWTYGTPMPTPRNRLAAAVVNDILYAIGGRNGYSSPDYLAANECIHQSDIAEFPRWTPFLIVLLVVTIVGVIYKRKLHKSN